MHGNDEVMSIFTKRFSNNAGLGACQCHSGECDGGEGGGGEGGVGDCGGGGVDDDDDDDG